MDLKHSVIERYEKEAEGNDNLSCGGKNIELAELKEGESILDIGCGRGIDVLNAANVIGESGYAVGIDVTPAMVKAANENLKKSEVKNASFILAEAENLPFEDDRFDVVISDCVINHSKDKEKVYRELYRVLKPGGRIVISDVVSLEELPDEIVNDPEEWADCFGGAIPEDRYISIIRDAGFKDIEYLKRREYLKKGYMVASITIRACKGGEY
ncbi:MAG: methyltransferase domain-containing protein [Thermoanaerobacteraceae bacterium]|nr:methyltransferase domain-containing protein [Thermoanaerobacteraceae bacterium]